MTAPLYAAKSFLLTYKYSGDTIIPMTHKKIFENYITTDKNGSPVNSEYYVPNQRNIEGFEMHFLKFIPENKNVKVLDIGCGCGQLLYALKQKGYNNIEGVDLGGHQVEITRKLGVKAERISDLEDYLVKNKEKWDVIALSQVIEHFQKDKMLDYLISIRNALKADGKVIIATPNMALFSGLVQRYTDFTHEVGFTERSLNEVLRIAGFSNIAIRGEEFSIKPRLKFLVWLLLRNIWFKILGFIYLLEKGTDRPKIISRHLIATAQK